LENQAVYSASKHFVEGLSKSLRKEGLLDGVKVTVVRPSGVVTAMTGNLDTTSSNVDKQSVELWNEVIFNMIDVDIEDLIIDTERQDEVQPADNDGVG